MLFGKTYFKFNTKTFIMKKGIFKAMAAGVALTALTACSDDLSISQNKFGKKADLTATFVDSPVNTRLGMLEKEGDNPWASGRNAGWSWVFTEGDKVRVWSMEAMTYNVYNITGGYDSPQATFALAPGQVQQLPADKDWWAITDAQFAYALSPNDEGKPVLTYTIPYKYTATSTEAEGTENADVRRLPAPFWGQARLDDDNTLDVGLNALTAFLRIEMNTLPAGTKYIVLTTHGVTTRDEAGNVSTDGFQLLEPDPNYEWTPQGTENHVKGVTGPFNLNSLASWENSGDLLGLVDDGNSEPLSGTFNAILENKQSKLAVDEGLLNEEDGDDWGMGNISRLVTRDEIVISLGDLEGGVFWIPVIAQHYNNLHVIAVVDKPSRYTYKYIGKELKKYENFEFKVAGRYRLTMNMTQFGRVCAHDLNEAIDEINQENKYKLAAENIINVDELIECPHTYEINGTVYQGHIDDNIYPTDQILVQGKGDLVLNIADITAQPGVKEGLSPVRSDLADYNPNHKAAELFVSDYNYQTNDAVFRTTRTGVDNANQPKSVTINMPAGWADTDGSANALLAELPAYDAVIAANNNYVPATQLEAQFLDATVYGSATKFVTGHDVKTIGSDGKVEIKNETEHAIKVINGIQSLNVMPGTKGDVFVDMAFNDAKVEINKEMNIYTTEGINVRIDNALVRKINFPEDCGNNENYVITTKSAAIASIDVLGNTTGDRKDPNDLNVLSYWTGLALDAEAVNIEEYDNGDVYTVAQLASMGEEIGQSATTTYKINDLVDNMWLGAQKYPWVGPMVTVSGFNFDGNNKSLLNMYMPLVASSGTISGNAGRNVYVYDPHICCTSCGWRQNGTSGSISDDYSIALEHFGLIRSIINVGADANVIKNVKLNDVNCTPGAAIADLDGVGSIVGYVETAGDITFSYDNVGEVQIDVQNDYVGGIAGHIAKANNITIDNSTVANSEYGTGTIKGKNYVGGMVGLAEVDEPGTTIQSITIESSLVDLANDLTASESYVGGLFGKAVAGDITLTVLKPTTVKVDGAISAGSENAFGQYAGGLFGYDKATTTKLCNANVTAGKVSAQDGFAGGEIGYLYGGMTEIGYYIRGGNNTVAKTNIAIGEIASAYAVGGLVGNNDNNAKVAVLAGPAKDNAANAGGSFITIDIAQFSNTKGEGAEVLDEYYKSQGEDWKAKYAGTFSNVIGKLDGKLYIVEANLDVTDNLQSEMKEKVGYTLRPDQEGTYNQGTRIFWGDYNGYVGAGKSGNYFFCSKSNDYENNATGVVGDQASNLYGYNLYKSAEKYSDKSKNAAE